MRDLMIGNVFPDAEPSDFTSEDERTRLLRELEATVESFRRGKTTKTSAVGSLLRILGENPHVALASSQKEASFDSFLAEILAIQASFDESSSRVDKPVPIERVSTPSNLVLKGPARRSHEDATSDSEDDGDKPSKKQRLIESDMPWYSATKDSSTAGNSDPSCQETRRLLRAYNRDISKAKFLIKVAPTSPSGIPSSQWERILRGESVDLNHFYASLHHVVPDEERTGRLGDTEIAFGVAEPKKKIQNFAQWSGAWKRASKAISFAFPHRREELFEYGEYIESEFQAKHTSLHHKIILFDLALRNEVGAGQHYLLTDSHKFTRLYSAIVLPGGVEGDPPQSSSKKTLSTNQSSGKQEICNKFNLGTCKQSNADCKYRHLCRGCRKSGHGKNSCPDESK
jgi:hypothetical protein